MAELRGRLPLALPGDAQRPRPDQQDLPLERAGEGRRLQGLNIGLACTSAGAGAVWAAQRADAGSGTPAALVKLSQTDLSEVARETLPPGASPGAVSCAVAGGGLVWVTDGVGSLFTIQP